MDVNESTRILWFGCDSKGKGEETAGANGLLIDNIWAVSIWYDVSTPQRDILATRNMTQVGFQDSIQIGKNYCICYIKGARSTRS